MVPIAETAERWGQRGQQQGADFNDPRAFLEALQPPVVREGSPTGRRLSRFGDHPSPRQRNIVGVERTCFAACNTRHGTDGRTADRQDTRPVILDEIQRAPQILLAVKRAVDELRRPGDFILTSSAEPAVDETRGGHVGGPRDLFGSSADELNYFTP